MRRYQVLAAALIAGCAGVAGPEDRIEVRTSAASYQVGSEIAASVANRTDGTIYIAHCDDRVSLVIERRVAAGWEHYGQSNGALCAGSHPMGEIAIERDRELTETLRIDEAGEFRLKIHARRAHEDFGSDVAVSRAFTVM